MPLSRPDADDGGLLYAGFNQDGSALTLTDATGVRVLSLESHAVCFAAEPGGLRCAEMLHTSSLLALVGAGHSPSLTPRRLALANTARGGATIAELPFAAAVTAVRLNRARLVALLASGAAHVFALDSLTALAVLPTGPNPGGLVALSDGLGGDLGAPGRLALPAPAGNGSASAASSSSPSGRVRVFELRESPRAPGPGGSAGALTPSVELAAHRAPLAALAWSADGGTLATASARGTVVRLWCFPAGAPAGTVRRGASTARINDLAFLGSASGRPTVLAAATGHGSVHLFRLGGGGSGGGSGGPLPATALASLAPPALTAALLPRRADAVVHLPAPTTGAIVALHPPRLVAGSDDEEEGSEGDAAGEPRAPSPSSSSPSGVTVCVVTAEGVLYEYGVTWADSAAEKRKKKRGAASAAAARLAAWAAGGGRGSGGGGSDPSASATVSLERELFVGRGV